MKKLKKILAATIIGVFLVSSLTLSISAFDYKKTLKNNIDECSECDTDLTENECILLDGKYPVMSSKPPMDDKYFKIKEYDPDPEPSSSLDDLPSQFSWKDYGGDWTTPARDQGNCGSCYIFGAIGAFEGAINIASGYPTTDIDLSEQYCLSCVNDGNYGCGGGWGNTIVEAIYSTEPGQNGNGINGCPIESCMPYQANDNIPCNDKCDDWDYFTDPPQSDNKLWQIDTWGWTGAFSSNNPNDWVTIKTWLLEHGPMDVDIYASNSWSSFFSSHHSPNDVYEQNDPGTTNHEVTLAGWVDDSSILNGGYWIIKNSWGPSFGYEGFFNIAYGCNSVGEDIVCWVKAKDWPQSSGGGPGPVDYNLAVFSNFDYLTYNGNKYPHPGDEVEFSDISDGDVALREWDFDGDGIIDSTQKNPTHIYYEEGEYEVTLTVTNAWGLNSDRTKIIKVLEFWPPKAVINYDTFILHDTLICDDFDARFSYDRDGGSITSYHWDFGDGATAEGSSPDHEFPQADKIYNVTLTVTDNDGASESASCQVKIDDTIPPETEILHRGYFELEEWYSDTQRIYFLSTDWTSVSDTFYRIDNGTWNKYEPEKLEFILVGSEGEHIIECYSVDYWQNQETIVSETFFIDKTEPTLDVTITGGEQINGWYTVPVTVELVAGDDYSGVKEINYKIDGNFWYKYTNSFTVGEGKHFICAFAVDNAGNANEECIREIKVDLDIPETTCFIYGQGTNNRYYKNVEITFGYVDKGSGVKGTYYNLDNEGYKTYYQPIFIDTLGEHTIEYYSIDNIGNQEQTKTIDFKISNVNFDLEITSPTNGLYFFGIRLLPIQKTILIGTAEIDVEITPFTQETANIDHVDFLLDGDIQKTITEYPYTWVIDQKMTGKHTIETIAYTNINETISDEITAILLII